MTTINNNINSENNNIVESLKANGLVLKAKINLPAITLRATSFSSGSLGYTAEGKIKIGNDVFVVEGNVVIAKSKEGLREEETPEEYLARVGLSSKPITLDIPEVILTGKIWKQNVGYHASGSVAVDGRRCQVGLKLYKGQKNVTTYETLIAEAVK